VKEPDCRWPQYPTVFVASAYLFYFLKAGFYVRVFSEAAQSGGKKPKKPLTKL